MVMGRWVVLAGITVITLGSSASAQTISSESWSDPRPGLRLLTGRTTGPTTRFWALHVDLCADRVHVAATARATSRRSAANWGSAVGVQAAVNGDFYRTDRSTPTVYGQAVGNGSVWPASQTGEGSAFTGEWYYRDYGWIAFGPSWVEINHSKAVKNGGIDTGWHPEGPTGSVPEGTIALVSGFPEIVVEGSPVTCSSPTASSCFTDRSDMRSRHPRTAMGLSEDRQTFILLVVDGRSSVSSGMYGTELASLMHQLGAHTAFNLDGGGSSQMWIQGSGTVSSPSDGSPRSVANHWGIYAGTAGGQPVVPGSCMPNRYDECFLNGDAGRCGELQAILGDDRTAGSTDLDGDGRADVCARGNAGLRCRLSTGEGYEAAPDFALAALSDAEGMDQPDHYATIRFGDIDGNDLADVCVRRESGIRCWPSTGTGWDAPIDGPGLDDPGTWNQPTYYSSIRLADVDGDGRDDLCARGYSRLLCWLSTGDGFAEEPIEGPAWGQAQGFDEPNKYGTVRMGDVNGDGLVDACARTAEGMECGLSDGSSLTNVIAGPAWSDGNGWTAVRHWSTIRLADVDGDGRADLCGRGNARLACHFSTGDGFGPRVEVDALSDDTGWNDHGNYASLRVGDLDGDGAHDLCIRANRGVWCYRWDGAAFARHDGPALSDADGWDDPNYYGTIRLADVTGEGRADLCARAATGWTCWPSEGGAFGDPIASDHFSDESGWAHPEHWATLRAAGAPCAAGACEDPPLLDGGVAGDGGPRWDGAPASDLGSGTDSGDAIDGGCGCRASGDAAGALWPLLLALVLRRRQR
jgi:MYXO-CTERM domain-containing protein